MGAKNNDSHSEKQAIVKFYTMEYRKCGNFNSKNDSRPCMGASAILKSVDFRAFPINVKTIAPTQKLYQSGHAIWHGDTPMAVRSFLESYDFTGKKVIPFCSSGSSAPQTSYNSVSEAVPGAHVLEGFWTRGADVGNAANDVNRWIDGLGVVGENKEGETLQSQIHITAGDTVFTATLADNSSADALKNILLQGPLTINMSDYANMEKVGPIGTSLPRNDEHIETEAGDLILYQGNSFVVYYGTNTWNFTRLGKIDGVTKEQLFAALGSGM